MKVFYSWQSDLPSSCNRGLIGDALERAAAAIASDHKIDIHPVVDRDTQSVPGSPNIAATILRKIDESDAVVCDVSIINKSSSHRPSPNPNVLVELGYALKALGTERLLLVQNTHFGTQADLPFDLRMHRVISYENSPGSKARAHARKDLERKLEMSLRAMAAYQRSSTVRIHFYDQQAGNLIDGSMHLHCLHLDPRLNPVRLRPRSPSGPLGMTIPDPSSFLTNQLYYEELVEYVADVQLLKPVWLAVRNVGTQALSEIEIRCVATGRSSIRMGDISIEPMRPSKHMGYVGSIADQIRTPPRSRPRVKHYDERAEITFGFDTLQPGVTNWTDDPFFIGSTESATVVLAFTIYAAELSQPDTATLQIDLDCTVREMTVEDLEWVTRRDDDEA